MGMPPYVKISVGRQSLADGESESTMSNYLPFTRPTIDEDTIESVGAETAAWVCRPTLKFP